MAVEDEEEEKPRKGRRGVLHACSLAELLHRDQPLSRKTIRSFQVPATKGIKQKNPIFLPPFSPLQLLCSGQSLLPEVCVHSQLMRKTHTSLRSTARTTPSAAASSRWPSGARCGHAMPFGRVGRNLCSVQIRVFQQHRETQSGIAGMGGGAAYFVMVTRNKTTADVRHTKSHSARRSRRSRSGTAMQRGRRGRSALGCGQASSTWWIWRRASPWPCTCRPTSRCAQLGVREEGRKGRGGQRDPGIKLNSSESERCAVLTADGAGGVHECAEPAVRDGLRRP